MFVDINEENAPWEAMSPQEKGHLLFLRPREMLDMFLERGAISKAQHDRSLRDLAAKMGETL